MSCRKSEKKLHLCLERAIVAEKTQQTACKRPNFIRLHASYNVTTLLISQQQVLPSY